MFQLDDNFLQDVGLGSMPVDQKKAFLQHLYGELEMRVGTVLADGLSDEQLQEFEKIIQRDNETVQKWLPEDYQNQPDFQKFLDNLKASSTDSNLSPDDLAVKAEFAATRWLGTNRPDYRDVVAKVLNQLKEEVRANKDAILGTTTETNQTAA